MWILSSIDAGHSDATLGAASRRRRPADGASVRGVPAHNESRVIAGLIRSLRTETYPQLRVVLALDRCTDDTASLARAGIAGDARFEIVEIDLCPADWAGKVHAVHSGVTRSRGAQNAEYLLFVDADTVFEPGCIAASLALMRQSKLDLLSLLSTLTHDTWFERFVQTAAAFELMRQYPLTRANGLRDRRAFANGQFMLFTRNAYDAVGGHAAVNRALLEDLALARLIDRSSLQGRCLPGRRAFSIAACTRIGPSFAVAGSVSTRRPRIARPRGCRFQRCGFAFLGLFCPCGRLVAGSTARRLLFVISGLDGRCLASGWWRHWFGLARLFGSLRGARAVLDSALSRHRRVADWKPAEASR